MAPERLPDFVIVGEMKSGTTSLAYYLDAHPEVFISPTRPVRFFDQRWENGIDWYRAQFSAAPENALLGDDTPNYLFDATAMDRLTETIPDAKLIVLLRDPVERAWSHYWHHDRTGFDRRGFEVAVNHELDHGIGALGTPEGSGYVARGRYVEQLEPVLERWPAAHVHIDFHEHLAADPGATYGRVCAFLGVDASTIPDNVGTVYNVGWTARRRRLNDAMYRFRLWEILPDRLGRRIAAWTTEYVRDVTMDEAMRAALAAHYADPDERLRALIGDLPWRGAESRRSTVEDP